MKKFLPLLALIGVLYFLTRSKAKGKKASGPTGIAGSGGSNSSPSFKQTPSSQSTPSGATTIRPSTAGISIPNSKANAILQQIANAQKAQRDFGGGAAPKFGNGPSRKSQTPTELPRGDEVPTPDYGDDNGEGTGDDSPTPYSGSDEDLGSPGDIGYGDIESEQPDDGADFGEFGGDSRGDFGGDSSGEFGGDSGGDFGDTPDEVGFEGGVLEGSW